MVSKPIFSLEGILESKVPIKGGVGIKVQESGKRFPTQVSFFREKESLVSGFLPGMAVQVHYQPSDAMTKSGEPYKNGVAIMRCDVPVSTGHPAASPDANPDVSDDRPMFRPSQIGIPAQVALKEAWATLRDLSTIGKIDITDPDKDSENYALLAKLTHWGMSAMREASIE